MKPVTAASIEDSASCGVDQLSGYNIDSPGEIVSLTRALPWYRWRRPKPEPA